jgi:hypothetical protein
MNDQDKPEAKSTARFPWKPESTASVGSGERENVERAIFQLEIIAACIQCPNCQDHANRAIAALRIADAAHTVVAACKRPAVDYRKALEELVAAIDQIQMVVGDKETLKAQRRYEEADLAARTVLAAQAPKDHDPCANMAPRERHTKDATPGRKLCGCLPEGKCSYCWRGPIEHD